MASNEAKVTLSFKLNGKVFSCEGNPANKERHFFDLARQRQVPEEEICTPYRENFPDRANDDDGSIIIRYKARLEKAKKRMAQKETKKEEEAPAAPAESSSTTPMKNKSTPQVVAINLPESQPLSLQSNHLHAQSQGHFERRHSTPMSPDEVRDLNQFITAVLSEDRGGGGAPNTNSVVPALEIPGAGSEMRRSVSDLTGEGAGGDAKSRITIFLQQDGVESQKMITIKPGAPFSEVAEMANKKIGSSVALSFVDSDGMRIDVDDDDSFEIFMEQGLKKLTLKCNPVCLTARGPHPSSNSPRGGSLGPAHMNNLIDMPSQNFGNAGSETARERNGATKNTKALVRTFLGHTAAVYGCAFSPDGTTVVSASRDRTLRIWSVERGITLQTIKAHNGFVLSCDYSPRGTHVASSSDDQQIRLFSVSGKKNYTIKEHTDKVYGICFAPHGDIMMSCSCDATVRVWNVETGSRLASIKPHEKPIFRIGLSRTDNARYAVTSSDDQTSALVHWKDGRVVRKLVGHKGTVWSSAFSSDDRYVVTSSMDHSIKVWDTGSGQEICTLLGHNTPVHRAMFADVSSIAESSPGISSNEIIISCAKDRTISAWDVNSATLIYAHSGHHHTVYDLAQSGRNLVSASFDCTLRLWNTKDVICPGL